MSIIVEAGAWSDEELVDTVDSEVSDFEKYFCKELQNSSLVKSERAILRTYLFWKTRPPQDTPDAEQA